jgi:TusA-related sulfurtransferase
MSELEMMSVLKHNILVDSRGRWCPPTPLTDLFKVYCKEKSGDRIELCAAEPGINADVRACATKTGNRVVCVFRRNGYLRILEHIKEKTDQILKETSLLELSSNRIVSPPAS